MVPATLAAGGDEALGEAAPPRLGRHEQVVHDAEAGRGEGLPAPVDPREADRVTACIAGDQLHALALGVGDQRAREREQRLVGGRHLVEVAIAAHERQQRLEVRLADARDHVLRAHVVMPVNCPPVMLSTWPWTKFDHGEQRKKTPPAASSGLPGRPSGISIEAIPRIWSGMPSCTFSPPISMTLSASLEAVSRVSM